MKPVKFDTFLKNIEYVSVKGDVDGDIRGAVINSSDVDKGYLFFALETGRRSGSLYASDALNRGAIAVVSEHDLKFSPSVEVKNSLTALTDFARYYRGLFNPQIIAVTGSMGKTTVKEMVYLILGSKYKTVKNEGNLNNHIGVPCSIFALNDDTEFAVFEMGMNHVGEIKHLSGIAKPNIGVITSIAPSHIGYFRDVNEILNAKLELYDSLPSGGTIFLNGYDEMLKNINRRRDVKHVIVGNNGNYSISEFRASKRAIEFKLNGVHFSIPLIGYFNAVNASIAAAIGEEYGIDLNESASILRNYKSLGGRMRILNVGKDVFVIDDTYNANPAAFNNMIDYMKANYEGDRYAVIGDMLELGKFSSFYHEKLGEKLREEGFKAVLYKGEYFHDLEKGMKGEHLKRLDDKSLEELIAKVKKGDVVLFKGSRGMRMEIWLEKFLKDYNNGL